MKSIISIICVLFLTNFTAAQDKPVTPSPKEQVQGIQDMCKGAEKAIKERQVKKSLYTRLGKKAKITVFVDKLYSAHKNNKKIGHMFAHVPKQPFSKNVIDFLTIGTGGKGKYSGRNMKDAHAHLNVTNEDFLAAGGDVKEVMVGMKYGENEIQEVICALASFIPDVVKN